MRSSLNPSSEKQGQCLLCQRESHLTFHHLIPRKLHRRNHFKKHYDKTTLNQGIMICRACHSGIHRLYDEMTLGKHFNTLEAIQQDEALSKHIAWVAKQHRTI